MIIGISGKAGSGKDTVADILAKEFGFVKCGLADPLKRIAREVFCFTDEQLWGSSGLRNQPDRRYPRRPDYWVYPACPVGSVWIPLHGERGYALIGEEDFDLVTGHHWVLNKKEEGKNTNYARATIGGKKVSLHTFLMNNSFLTTLSEGQVVDHINGNGLDNRRRNLRACTKEENRRNAEKRKDGESIFKGVGRSREGWRAYIKADGKFQDIGHYSTEEEAAAAYDVAASKHFGEFARLNSDRYLTPRHALQQLGTQWGRDCYENVWIEYAVRVANQLEKGGYAYHHQRGLYPISPPEIWMWAKKDVAIPDVRFKNEIDGLKQAGAVLIRVKRPVAGLEGAAGAHRSETEQDDIPDAAFDFVINNEGTLAELHLMVKEVMRTLKGEVEGAQRADTLAAALGMIPDGATVTSVERSISDDGVLTETTIAQLGRPLDYIQLKMDLPGRFTIDGDETVEMDLTTRSGHLSEMLRQREEDIKAGRLMEYDDSQKDIPPFMRKKKS